MDSRSTDELTKILWDYNQLHQKVENADVIIGLGSHDTRVAVRGAELYFNKYAPLLLFSGGFGRLTDTLWTSPEAEMFRGIALNMGVPQSDILIENKSTNTEENIRFSKKLLDERGIRVKKVILVHNPYMERRQYATWQKIFPDIIATVTSPQMSYEEYINGSPVSKDEIINIIVGDTQRIEVYPSKGFIIYQEIPKIVLEAYRELVDRGYTTQLVRV
jgi:uncharacterized SAM-binding protein YcdF (DUF218 family)